MEKKIVKNQIINLLENITEQAETILSYEQHIPKIELDIISSNIRNLYENIYFLTKLNNASLPNILKDNEEIPRQIIEKTEIIFEEKKTEIVENILIEEPQKEEYVLPKIEKVEEKVVKQTYISPTIEKNIYIKKEETPRQTEVEQNIKQEKQSKTQKPKSSTPLDLFGDSSAILKDKFVSETTVNEKLHSEEETSLISKIQKEGLKDLKSAIGINEKFLFINELFDGNMQDYNDTISNLNENCSNIEEAHKLLKILKNKYNWDTNRSSYNLLKSLVERRF